MRAIINILLFLNSLFVLGQKEEYAIKIYLEDAYSGKNITDAKVTLEGFEIPEIIGQYDKKGKFYFFSEIPEGYNTVMAYHQKYNEKGLQKKSGLPYEIILKLCDKLNIIHEQYPLAYGSFVSDSIYLPQEFKFYRNVYIEDPYKIMIKVKGVEGCEKLDSLVKSKNLFVEIIDPYFQYNSKTDISFVNFSCNNYFNQKYLLKVSDKIFEDIPNYGIGFGSQRFSNEYFRYKDYSDIKIILRKKDGSRFKRFNDPVIKDLKKLGLNINFISYLRFSYQGDTNYQPHFALLQKYNSSIEEVIIRKKSDNRYLKLNEDLLSRVFLYSYTYEDNVDYYASDIVYLNPESDVFVLKGDISDSEILNYEDLGLGFLDQYDYLIIKQFFNKK